MSNKTSFDRVKVFGERGTGTNFVAKMIHANFKAEILVQPLGSDAPSVHKLAGRDLTETAVRSVAQRIEDFQHETGLGTFGGWKHACLTNRVFERMADADRTLFLCVVRHPALWARSLMKHPFSTYLKTPDTLEAFLAQPWITRPRDEVPELVLDGPAKLWQYKTTSYLDQAAARPNVLMVRHEDFLRDHIGQLAYLGSFLRKQEGNWKIVTSYGRNFQADGPDFRTIRDALPDQPFSAISDKAAKILRLQIGDDLITRAGYTPPE